MMLGFIRALKFVATVVAATVMLLGASSQCRAQTKGPPPLPKALQSPKDLERQLKPDQAKAEGLSSSKHFTVRQAPTLEFDVFYDCKTHPPEWYNLYANPQITPGTAGSWGSSIHIIPRMEVCEGPPGSHGCAHNWSVVTINYLFKSDLSGKKQDNMNVELGDKIDCDCTCGGATR